MLNNKLLENERIVKLKTIFKTAAITVMTPNRSFSTKMTCHDLSVLSVLFVSSTTKYNLLLSREKSYKKFYTLGQCKIYRRFSCRYRVDLS